MKLAEAAKANCPVSKVLNATITLDADAGVRMSRRGTSE